MQRGKNVENFYFLFDGFPYVIAPVFSTPAFSIRAIYSRIFHSCIFYSHIFSAPSGSLVPSFIEILAPSEKIASRVMGVNGRRTDRWQT